MGVLDAGAGAAPSASRLDGDRARGSMKLSLSPSWICFSGIGAFCLALSVAECGRLRPARSTCLVGTGAVLENALARGADL